MIGIELNPEMVAAFGRMRFLGRASSGYGRHCLRRRVRPTWAARDGVYLLVRWSGERWPLPGIGPGHTRAAAVVGFVLGTDVREVLTFASVAHSVNTIYHLAVVPVSGGGIVGAVSPHAIQSRTTDGSGNVRGLMPNAPNSVQVRVIDGGVPIITWSYSAAYQQVPPVDFGVYVASGESDVTYTQPIAAVAYQRGRTRYEWVGAALSAGDVRYYSVRARSAAGVLSRIPQMARTPAGDYGAVSRGYAARLTVPADAPALASGLVTGAAR